MAKVVWTIKLSSFLVLNTCVLLNVKYFLFQNFHDTEPTIPVLSRLKESIDKAQSGKLSMNTSLLSCIDQSDKCIFEDIGKFLEGTAPGIVHEPQQSVPSYRRIPHHMANNWTYILEQRYNLPMDGSRTALYDYNPVILPLYQNGKNGTVSSDLDIELLDRLTGRYHPYFSKVDSDHVKYLSICRISALHGCGPRLKHIVSNTKTTKVQHYVGISLLDENLARVKGADVTINLSRWITNKTTDDFMDFSIYSARTAKDSAYKDQLFLTVSGQTYSFIFPFDIRRIPPSESASLYPHFDDSWKTKVKGRPIPTDRDDVMYGTGLQVRFMDDKRMKKGIGQFNQGPGTERGKNHHFFESSDGTTHAEFWPTNPHRTRPINFFASAFASYEHDVHYFPGSTVEGRKRVYPREVIKSNAKREPDHPSFKSPNVFHLKLKQVERGTSCCVDMTLEGDRRVKVGILHGAVKPRNYLSKFYAFVPEPPFDMVAVTGWFCLGHMREDDIGFASQWISRRPANNRTAPDLIDGAGVTSCPKITFASGLTEMIGYGGENIIVSYGVNDCYSRSIIVPKKKIEMLLLGQTTV